MWYVYMLLCEDGSFYTGISVNLKKRFLDHQSGKGGKYTRSHKVLKIVYSEAKSTHSEALKREILIKKLSHQDKISLIKPS